MKEAKKSPEAVIAEQMKAKKTISGIGFIITASIVSIVISIIEGIQKLTKKKPASTPSTSDTPTAEDWQGLTTQDENAIKTGLANPVSDFTTDADANTLTSNTRKATGICG